MIIIKGWKNNCRNFTVVSKVCERITVSKVVAMLDAVRACEKDSCVLKLPDGQRFKSYCFPSGRIILRQLESA